MQTASEWSGRTVPMEFDMKSDVAMPWQQLENAPTDRARAKIIEEWVAKRWDGEITHGHGHDVVIPEDGREIRVEVKSKPLTDGRQPSSRYYVDLSPNNKDGADVLLVVFYCLKKREEQVFRYDMAGAIKRAKERTVRGGRGASRG